MNKKERLWFNSNVLVYHVTRVVVLVDFFVKLTPTSSLRKGNLAQENTTIMLACRQAGGAFS